MKNNNIVKMPLMASNKEEESVLVDFSDIDPITAGKLFDVMDLLSNKEELISSFSPKIKKFLKKEVKFKDTVYRKAYEEAFEDYVMSLIKHEVVEHFPDLTPEEIIILCDKDLVSLLTDDYYFNKENYKGV